MSRIAEQFVCILIACAVMIGGIGCASTEPAKSLNYERSGLRAAGDLGATAAIEEGGWDAEDVALIGQAVVRLLEEGDTTELTYAALQSSLLDGLPEAYRPLVQKVIALFPPNVPIDRVIDADTRSLLRAFALGMRVGAGEYRQ